MKKLYSIILTFMLFGCQEKVEVLPVVADNITLHLNKIELLNINDLAVEASLNTSSDQVIDYGFIVSEYGEPNLERGKVVKVGAANAAVTFSYTYAKLDTGNTYNVRAYAQLKDKVVYSEVKSTMKISPVITSVYPHSEISNFSSILISTNLTDLSNNQQISVYLDEHLLNVKSSNTNTEGTYFEVELPESIQSGKYTLSIKLDQFRLVYKYKITLLPGKWEKITDLPFNDWYYTTTFMKDDWVYMLQNKGGKTEFFKQNIKTGEKVLLVPYGGSQWFLHSPAVIVNQSKVHFIGGEEFSQMYVSRSTSKHYIYDLQSNKWSQEEDFPGDSRVAAVSGIFNNKIYYGLGFYSPPQTSGEAGKLKNDLWEYDLPTKKWTQLESFPQSGRSGQASFMVGSQLYVVGGYEQNRPTKGNWCYNVNSNKWTRKADYPGKGFTGFTGFAIGNYGYVGMGEIGSFSTVDSRELYTTFFRYNPQLDQWNRVSDFNGDVPLNKYTTSEAGLGFLIGEDGLYSSSSLPIYSFKP